MTDTYDKSSKLKLDGWLLDQAKFKKTVDEKIAVRVGNEDSNPLYVVVTDGPSGIELSAYDEVTALTNDTVATIITYIVPPTKYLEVQRITVSGSNIAKYTVKFNGSINKVKRSYYGATLNEEFNYDLFNLPSGTIVTVEVVHHNDVMTGDFEANIEGRLNNES